MNWVPKNDIIEKKKFNIDKQAKELLNEKIRKKRIMLEQNRYNDI